MKIALLFLVLGSASAFGQDDAAAMAAQQAMQMSQQATQQAMQDMQQASQQAQQNCESEDQLFHTFLLKLKAHGRSGTVGPKHPETLTYHDPGVFQRLID